MNEAAGVLMGKHLLKCGSKNTRLRWDCSQHGERDKRAHTSYIIHLTSAFVLLLEEFYLIMAFQILKLIMSVPIIPFILRAFAASIEENFTSFCEISCICGFESKRWGYCVTFMNKRRKSKINLN
jgi:hypothetical protein